MKRARGSAKSRLGCQTCKDRRIKCDETRPECQGCLRGGLRCPGYVRPLRWSRKHEVHANLPVPAVTPGRQHDASASDVDGETSRDLHREQLPPGLFEGSSRMSDWLDLNLDGAEAELAFQDATALMSHSFPTTATPVLLESTLPFHHLDAEGSMTDNQDGDSAGSLTAVDDGTSVLGMAAGSDTRNWQGQADDRPSRSQQSTQGPRALLRTFYRLSSPESVHQLSDEDFVNYYFKHVCRLHSCFDSTSNLFRTLCEKWWSSSPTVSFTIQSMAVAHIANWYPYVTPLGIYKRNLAWRSLQKDLQLQRSGRLDLDKALLCLFLLGISASWQRCSHLGLQYLHITRNLVQSRIKGVGGTRQIDDLSDFWASALIYWEMLASFVDPVTLTSFDGHGLPILEAQPLTGSIVPHPWTGIAAELYFALAEVARVARRETKSSECREATTSSQLSNCLDFPWLRNLEELIVTTQIPEESLIEDYNDSLTSKTDLIRNAEACKGVGLLEIYRLCPQLLAERVRDEKWRRQLPSSIFDQRLDHGRDPQEHVAMLAVRTIDLMINTPLSSGACHFQPLLLMACASYLRLGTDHGDILVGGEGEEVPASITQYRYILEARMFALSKKLPQTPVLKAIDIIKEVWDRLDDGKNGHWIGTMHEKDWQTILG